MTEKKETGFRCLEQNIMDVILETQIKLGYAESPLRLFYPLASLNHELMTELDEAAMEAHLAAFSAYVQPRLGEILCARRGERFTLVIPAEGARYVHVHMQPSDFLAELVEKTAQPNCTPEQAERIFQKHSDCVVRKQMDNGEFDFLLYFADGKPDDYVYCFHQEGTQLTYHRFGKADYEDFRF